MSDEKKVCVICEGASIPGKRLVNNPAMIEDLLQSCRERVSLGENNLQTLADHLSGLNDQELKLVCYHSECRKPIVNKSMIERLRGKRSLLDSPGCSSKGGPGRPPSATGPTRPKRLKTVPKEKVCLFSQCKFCPKTGSEALHHVFTDAMGQTLLEIKQETQDDQVRICVADLEDVGDASAFEKYYHRNCLRAAKRTLTSKEDHERESLTRSLCDEQLILAIENTINDDVTLNIAQVNDAYLSILKRYHTDVDETKNCRKYLKKLIEKRLPEVQFVSSLRRNEPEKLVRSKLISKAIDLSYLRMDDGEIIGNLKNVAGLLRREIMQMKGWSFTGTFDDFKNPSLLQFFLSHLLFGCHVVKVSGVRDQEVDKTVDVSCQFLVQNTHTDRQVKYQPKTDHGFRQNVQTPLSIGLPLAIHSRVRDKSLVQNLSEVYIGSDYHRILDLEKRVEQSVLQRMKDAGGYCLPDFIKRGVNIWFAIDNIDLLEDTPTGQETFHGTVVVINQEDVDGESVNQPLVIPEKLSSENSLAFELNVLPEPVIGSSPLRFRAYKKRKQNLACQVFTHTWALVNYLTTDGIKEKIQTDAQPHNEGAQHYEDMPTDVQSSNDEEIQFSYGKEEDGSSKYRDEKEGNDAVIVVKKKGKKSDKLAKNEILPTWAATRSLLLSQSPHACTPTNTAVIAPLFKTSPTDYGTLYTVLRLSQGISASVVGPNRKTLITLDLDLYYRALKIQQSVGNTNWILKGNPALAIKCSVGKEKNKLNRMVKARKKSDKQ